MERRPEAISQDELIERLSRRVEGDGRYVLGLTGPPGAGKSSLARSIASALQDTPPVVPMDGFHLAQDVIDSAGLAESKGSPETFDAAGFVNLLERIVHESACDHVVYAPMFDRNLEQPIAGAIAVRPSDRLVIVEGNYLLVDKQPWSRVRPLLNLCAYLDFDEAIRTDRLVSRHIKHGRSPADAQHFVERSDQNNSRLIESTRSRADIVVDMNP